MLSVQNLQCSYGDIVALHDLSFEARAGEIFALIGARSFLPVLIKLIENPFSGCSLEDMEHAQDTGF